MPLCSTEERFFARLQRGRVLIVGFGERTGRAAAELFERRRVPYRISDAKPRGEIEPLLAGLHLADEQIRCGGQEPGDLEGITAVLLSPGVPRTIPLLEEAKRRRIPVEVDIDFGYELWSDKRIVAITGTDGKTTTTTLTGKLLEPLGPVVVAGNIGVSPLARLDEIRAASTLVLEVSSFMTEELSRFRPSIAGILNIAEDHVDRYDSRESYAAAKFGLVRHCRPGDALVLNVDEPTLAGFRPEQVTILRTSRQDPTADSHYHEGTFHLGELRIRYAECRLQGQANVDNILMAATMARTAGVDPQQIATRLRRFEGLPHRMQHLGRFDGVDVYEDSKASNVHAVEAALRNFDRGVVLILGGRDKGLDFSILKPHAHRLRRLVCYGESGEAIRDALDIEGALYRYDFEQAVRLAATECHPGDVLLLSPGCTSWDQFPNYEVRGDTFRRLVPRLFA
ncbi:MAG: UDP-N-acetylmuramoyl-L-alanine--D-glutamate ligase [Deltaproteobacteria bacterium]|jgi:UDP-N-acetylmuramoylalanine--D-glutamate ligase|nr:UDP-N-acetylmuramoyl-L-alanine--D-glutamate ligase [Deltaproteobacteria bacterium]MBW2533819.1 UDP-N-acetylmuramoyl-L-alanine--D-glutamate ligase [Deltaproteobacteria bacterium]